MRDKKFTDEEVTEACNLHIDNLRRLITWGAVTPVQAGGGRGRVRLWTLSQAMRIAVTAEFVEAGFSLQMGHTLTYCLPFDDMLNLYDPEFLKKHIKVEDSPHVRAMLSPSETNYWPDKSLMGSVLFVVNRRLVYGNLLHDEGQLFGVIDVERNRFLPFWDPNIAWRGNLAIATGVALKRPAFKRVSRQSLLIDDAFFPRSERKRSQLYDDLHRVQDQIFHSASQDQIDEPDKLYYRSLLKLNLNIGLVIAFRRLNGFPVSDPLAWRE
jgi:hypothetical protein